MTVQNLLIKNNLGSRYERLLQGRRQVPPAGSTATSAFATGLNQPSFVIAGPSGSAAAPEPGSAVLVGLPIACGIVAFNRRRRPTARRGA